MAEPGTDRYSHPLGERYASREMQAIFAPMHRYGGWLLPRRNTSWGCRFHNRHSTRCEVVSTKSTSPKRQSTNIGSAMM